MPKTPDVKPSRSDQLSIAAELIDRCIFLIRGHKVMIDADHRISVNKRLHESWTLMG